MAGWTVCTTSAGCTGSERSRSRPTNRSSTSRGKVGSGRCSVRWRPPPTGAASGAQANRYAEQDATTLVTDPADGRAGTASAERGARGATRCSTAPSPGGTDRPELGGGAGPAAGDEGRVAQALDGCPSARIVGAAQGAQAVGGCCRRCRQGAPERPSGGRGRASLRDGGTGALSLGPQPEHLLPARHLTCRRQWLPRRTREGAGSPAGRPQNGDRPTPPPWPAAHPMVRRTVGVCWCDLGHFECLLPCRRRPRRTTSPAVVHAPEAGAPNVRSILKNDTPVVDPPQCSKHPLPWRNTPPAARTM